MKIYIDELTWSGWTPEDFEPKLIKKHELEVMLNNKYVITALPVTRLNEKKEWVEGIKEVFSFEVIDLNEKYIKIKTNTNFRAIKNNEVIANTDEYIIYLDEEIELSSNTLDMGWIYKIVLKKD